MRTFNKKLNVSTNKPSFSVHRNGTNQTNITGTNKVEWTTEVFDTNSDFDSTTNYRFTPTVAGKYLLSTQVTWDNATVISSDRLFIYLYKNGASYAQNVYAAQAVAGGYDVLQITTVVDANGTSDYFEVYAQNAERNTSGINGEATFTYFTGCKID